jgi:Ca2+-binding EF-hand superfamily protein
VIFYWSLVARHISRSFDIDPELRPPPTPLPFFSKKANDQISLSEAQENQIKEIFALFDTDGGGSIDRKELEFAMTALGFQSQDADINRLKGKQSASTSNNLLDTIVGDGKVTLAEFIGLMTGEVMGRNQHEEAQTVFAALCGSDGEGRHDNLVTLGKLEAACRKFEVRRKNPFF